MPEEILFSDERRLERTEVATYLHTVADRLDAGGSVSFETATDDVTVSVPGTVEFEVTVEREGPAGKPGELGLELELEWDEDADATDDSLSIR